MMNVFIVTFDHFDAPFTNRSIKFPKKHLNNDPNH